MDLKRLAHFVRAVECGSLSRAAAELGIAQPALTQQVAALEHAFGAKLLIRSSRGIRPTEAGEELVLRARALLRQAASLADSVRAAGRPAGEVSVGLATALAPHLGPLLAALVAADHPTIRLRIFEAESHLGRELVARGRADLSILCESTAPATGTVPAGGAELEREDLFLQPLALLCRRDRQNREGQPITLREAASRVGIAPGAGNPVHAAWMAALEAAGLAPPPIAVEMQAYALQAAAVTRGLGAAITTWTPDDAVRRAQGLVFRPLRDPALTLAVRLCAPSVPTSLAASAVRSILRRAALQMAAAPGWPRPPSDKQSL